MDINYIPHIPVRMVTRPCFVRGEKAIFHMFAEWISPELHEWRALVEYEDGRVRQVRAEDVVFADGGEFKELAWDHAGRMYIQYREITDEDNALVKMRDVLDIIKELHSTEEGHTADILFRAFCKVSELNTHGGDEDVSDDIEASNTNGDFISREEAISEICRRGCEMERSGTCVVAMVEAKQFAVDVLQDIRPEKVRTDKHSKWVDYNPRVTDLKCCEYCEYIVGAEESAEWNYCPNCGADMRGDA